MFALSIDNVKITYDIYLAATISHVFTGRHLPPINNKATSERRIETVHLTGSDDDRAPKYSRSSKATGWSPFQPATPLIANLQSTQ